MGKKKGGVRVKQVGPKAPPPQPILNPMDAFSQIPPEEMVHLPSPVDRSYQVIWPIQETFSTDYSSFQVIYPSYLDSTKSVSRGRKIAQSHAVPVPTVVDITQALQVLNVRHVLQPYKGYSRDVGVWDNPGRVLVDVHNTTKTKLLRDIASQASALPDRRARLEQEAAIQANEEAERAQALKNAKSPAVPAKTGTSNSKKKGKKGRKK